MWANFVKRTQFRNYLSFLVYLTGVPFPYTGRSPLEYLISGSPQLVMAIMAAVAPFFLPVFQIL